MWRLALGILIGLSLSAGVAIAWRYGPSLLSGGGLLSPLVVSMPEKPKPLLAFSINALRQKSAQVSPLVIEKTLSRTNEYMEVMFSFKTLGKRMTGQLTLPVGTKPTRAIVMLRGYVPPEEYATGVGTKPAARVFAQNNFAVFAPDFLGYGESDPEPTDTWEARFIKPFQVVELLASLQQLQLTDARTASESGYPITLNSFTPTALGLWGHSNGGQIALTTLELLDYPLPTALWAPVTAPFPYSILFYGDEVEDEGKLQRKWLSLFEQDYDAFDFSLTRHLKYLRGPLQLHHGDLDEAAPKAWSDEFIAKIDLENARRQQEASTSALPEPIRYEYLEYSGADHNLRPVQNWNQVVQRDLGFFNQELN